MFPAGGEHSIFNNVPRSLDSKVALPATDLPLLRLRNVTLRVHGEDAFANTTWTLARGEQWARNSRRRRFVPKMAASSSPSTNTCWESYPRSSKARRIPSTV